MDRDRRVDLLIVAAIIAAEVSNLFLVSDGAGHRDPSTIALLVAPAVPLVRWRRAPFIVSLMCATLTIILSIRGDPHLGLAVIASTFGVALWGRPISRRVTLAAMIVGVPLVPLLTDDAGSIPKDLALYAAAWILGTILRERRVSTEALQERARELEREREEKAALAADAERARIARELHDVLTHSMSVMVIQAQAGQAALGDDARVAGALSRIESVGKESLVELRRLLQRVRGADESPGASAGAGPGAARAPARRGAVGRPRGIAHLRWRGTSAARERRPLGLSDPAGGADEHAPTRRHRDDSDRAPLSPRRARARGHRPWSHDGRALRQRKRPGGHARARRPRRRQPRGRGRSRRRVPRGGTASAAGGAVTLRVVVADDQELVRDGFRMILQASGIEVAGEARDGREAIALARRTRPDVVLMDIRMPVMNGIEATRELAGPGAAEPVVVLILTTFDLDEYVVEALRAGASGFLLKDAGREQLVSAVEIVAAGESLLAPSVTRRLVERFVRTAPSPPPASSAS